MSESARVKQLLELAKQGRDSTNLSNTSDHIEATIPPTNPITQPNREQNFGNISSHFYIFIIKTLIASVVLWGIIAFLPETWNEIIIWGIAILCPLLLSILLSYFSPPLRWIKFLLSILVNILCFVILIAIASFFVPA